VNRVSNEEINNYIEDYKNGMPCSEIGKSMEGTMVPLEIN
jgi:hypothetical protein